MIGTVLHDRWRILAELGKGGMGEVYLAEHLVLDRKEALKILMPQAAKDPQFVSRFRREARAVNRLRHPNIVALYDFGQLADGRFYLSMEYADGIGLNQLLRVAAPLELGRALNLIGQLAYALHHAHSRGVMHRDLKPGNLIVTDDADHELLKVLDFGMAKIVASEYAESVALSTGNVIWGTAKYMSPERITGTGNDPRTDLYAIGCIAFELVTGKPPFGGTANEMLHAHVTMPPEIPSRRRPELPPELDAVILRCLEKKPADRWQGAADLFAALHKVPGYPVAKAEPRRRYVPQERLPSPTSFVQPTREDASDLRGVLRGVAEALLDQGLDDTRLVSGVAYLRDHERALARLEAAQDALEHEASAVRETARDREASLRFAIGELEFAAQQTDATEPQDASRIRELEGRLRATTEDVRLRTIEQGLGEVTALRTSGLDKVKAAYDELERVVDELLAGRPELEPHARRLAAVRARRTGR